MRRNYNHPYNIFIIGDSGSLKTNALLNSTKEQDSDNIFEQLKDLGIKHSNDSKAFIEHSNTMYDVYNNIDDDNPTREREISIT